VCSVHVCISQQPTQQDNYCATTSFTANKGVRVYCSTLFSLFFLPLFSRGGYPQLTDKHATSTRQILQMQLRERTGGTAVWPPRRPWKLRARTSVCGLHEELYCTSHMRLYYLRLQKKQMKGKRKREGRAVTSSLFAVTPPPPPSSSQHCFLTRKREKKGTGEGKEGSSTSSTRGVVTPSQINERQTS
jgi:hypothetical protein